MFDPKLAEPDSEDAGLLSRIDPQRIPRHIAIIMDGNGRWARQRHLPRAVGHRSGIRAVRDTVEVAARLGVEALTLYAFSSENWKRPRSEVETLMGLLREYLRKDLHRLIDNDIKLQVIGRIDDLPKQVRRDVDWALQRTEGNTGLKLYIALSYSGRAEIVDACRSILRSGIAPEALDGETFAQHLYAPNECDPDLLIRTSGELRISNFLLWQIAYAEIWVTDTLWPDFKRGHLFSAILDYQGRERRYGGLKPAGAPSSSVIARG